MTTEVGTPEVRASALGRDAAERRTALLGTLGAITGALVIFSPILYQMVLHWRGSDDYSHGFLIAPLAL